MAAYRPNGGALDTSMSSVSHARLAKETNALSGRLRREVNPVVMTLEDFKKRNARRDRFVSRVVGEPHTLLIGDARDFAQFAKDLAAIKIVSPRREQQCAS